MIRFLLVVLAFALVQSAAARAQVTPSENAANLSTARHNGIQNIINTHPAKAAIPFGTFYNCQPEWGQMPKCVSNLATLGSVGFKYVVNYGTYSGNLSEIQQEITQGSADGLQHTVSLVPLYWYEPGGQVSGGFASFASTYLRFTQDCQKNAPPCTTIDQAVTYLVHGVDALPGTWGYYINDENPGANEPQVAELVAAIRAAGSTKPTWCGEFSWTNETQAEMNTYFAAYKNDCSNISTDYYPYGTGGVQIPSETARLAGITQAVATTNGVGYGFELQSYAQCQNANPPHPHCQWYSDVLGFQAPTRAEMVQQQAWAVGNMTAPDWLWTYSYLDIFRSDDPNSSVNESCQHWQDTVFARFGTTLPPTACPL